MVIRVRPTIFLGLLADDGRRSFFFSTNFQHPPPVNYTAQNDCTDTAQSSSLPKLGIRNSEFAHDLLGLGSQP